VRQAALTPEERAAGVLSKLGDEGFAQFAKELPGKSEPEQRAFLGLLRAHREKRERWKTWKKKKPELARLIDQTREKLNLPPLP
jgi:hypothetical protein